MGALVSPVVLGEDKGDDKTARWVAVREAVPADIGQYQRLVLLDCTGVSALPRALGSLPLERLDIDWYTGLRSIPDAVWGIESLGYISMYDSGLGLNMAQVNNLLAGFVRAKTPRKQRIVEVALLRGEAPRVTTRQLFVALDSNVKTVRTQALMLLEKQMDNPLTGHPIRAGSVVAVLGSLNIGKKALKDRVEPVGARLANKVNEKTTHVLLGEKPGGGHHDLGELPVLLERHLVSQASKAAASKDAGELSLEQLARDLRSKKDAKICGAIQTLQEHGGVPGQLLPELFWVLQNTELEKLGKGRKLARKLFAAYAPARLRSAVAAQMKTSVLLAGETKRSDRLAALERAAGPVVDMAHLARVLVEDFDCGLKFILARGDVGEIQWALQRRIKGHRIDLAGLELETLPDLSSFDLKEVDASQNRLPTFPAELSSLPALTALDLSVNYMRSLPRSLAEFKTLKKLDLSNNQFQTFPRGVITILGLRELNLSTDTWGETRITKIPKEVVSMTSLEVLKIENGHVAVDLPKEMSAMTWLRQLKVTWKGGGKKPPADLRRLLPKCKVS